MNRQRVNLRSPIFGRLVAGLTLVLAVALLWYGLMVVLLAVKVASCSSLPGSRSASATRSCA